MDARKWLVVVHPNEPDLFELFRQTIVADGPVRVIVERRMAGRRRGGQPVGAERRRAERRRRRAIGWVYEGELANPEVAASPQALPLGSSADNRSWTACPDCGMLLEFEAPRFPSPPAQLQTTVVHERRRLASGADHYIDFHASTTSTRTILAQRIRARRV